MIPKPYRFKKPRPPIPQRFVAPRSQDPIENLSGFVYGIAASDLEERWARALAAKGIDFSFQYEVLTAYGVPGQENVVDFIVWSGLPYPIEIDGGFSHKTAAQKEEDRVRDALVDESLKREGCQPVRRVDGKFLETQEGADQMVQEMFG